MPAHFITDSNLGAGYGIINVPNIACEHAPTFALYRASDGLCLTPNGWQNAEIFLQPTNWDCDTNTLRLSVDASIVDHLDALDTYKILIKDGNNEAISQTLVIQDIVYSSMHGGQGVGFIEKTPDPMPEPEPVTEPEPEPIPEQVTTPAQSEALPEIEPVHKKSSLPIILFLILLLLLSLGIWWYLQNKANDTNTLAQQTELTQESEEESSEETVKQEETAKNEPANEEKGSASQESSSTSEENAQTEKTAGQDNPNNSLPDAAQPSLSPIQQAREILRQNVQGQVSFELAEKLKASPSEQATPERLDAQFLLLEDAAQKNVAAAMVKLARYYDPSNTEPKGSIEADANEAYTWYNKALSAGRTEAQTYLDALKAWAQEAAQNGDDTAKALLNKWK